MHRLTDATLRVVLPSETRDFPVSRALLAVRSRYFASLLSGSYAPASILTLDFTESVYAVYHLQMSDVEKLLQVIGTNQVVPTRFEYFNQMFISFHQAAARCSDETTNPLKYLLDQHSSALGHPSRFALFDDGEVARAFLLSYLSIDGVIIDLEAFLEEKAILEDQINFPRCLGDRPYPINLSRYFDYPTELTRFEGDYLAERIKYCQAHDEGQTIDYLPASLSREEALTFSFWPDIPRHLMNCCDWRLVYPNSENLADLDILALRQKAAQRTLPDYLKRRHDSLVEILEHCPNDGKYIFIFNESALVLPTTHDRWDSEGNLFYVEGDYCDIISGATPVLRALTHSVSHQSVWDHWKEACDFYQVPFAYDLNAMSRAIADKVL